MCVTLFPFGKLFSSVGFAFIGLGNELIVSKLLFIATFVSNFIIERKQF